MDRREFLGRLGAALAGISLTSQASSGSARPNFLVIVTDDQPYYTIPCMKAVSSMAFGAPQTWKSARSSVISSPVTKFTRW